MVCRRITFKIYPSAKQEMLLWQMRDAHCDLYNAALQERVEAYQKKGISIKKSDQEKSITLIRQADPLGYGSIKAQSLQGTVKRLDLAFQAFFRNVKAGNKPGFPRFKSKSRFKGWSYKTHGDGWKLYPGSGWKNGYLRLSGIGYMQIRGEARTPGIPKTCTITRKLDQWYASVVVECETHRKIDVDAHAAMTLDWGQITYAALAWSIENDGFEEIPNERFWQDQKDQIIAAQRALPSGRVRLTKRQKKRKRELALAHRRLSNRRKNRNHQTSAYIARRTKMFGTEKLTVKDMTRSAKGSTDKPGKNVKQKAGNNREALDTAPAALLKMIQYKVEETGAGYIEIPTRLVKPSQRCPVAWTVKKKRRDERSHTLPCGRIIGRDHAFCATQLRWMLEQGGHPVPWVGNQPRV